MADDKDKGIVAIFKNHTSRNEAKSAAAGRPIFDDMEIVELRFAGSRNLFVFPALAFSHWEDDMENGGQRQVIYAERFARQYQQFKSRQQQTKSGTPLDYLSFLSEGKRSELRALNIYTAEALAIVDGAELKNLGHGGRELKNQAAEYLAHATDNAAVTRVQAELEAMRAKNEVLEQDIAAAKIKIAQLGEEPAQFSAMSDEQLRDYIKTKTGGSPKGAVPRKTLVRMAEDATARVDQ
jgi:hypothetical protein